MLNYLRAELYKLFHRTYFWVTLLVTLGLESLLIGGWVFINQNGAHVCFDEALHMLSYELVLGLYFTVIMGDIVFAGQYKNATLKNEVSFGLPRWRIYLGKLAAQLIAALLTCFVMMVYYVALCRLLLPADSAVSGEAALGEFATQLLFALPLWIGAQAAVCACLFGIKGGTGAAITAVALFGALPVAVQIVGMMFGIYPFGQAVLEIYSWLPSVMLERVPSYVSKGDWSYLANTCLVGGVWLAVPTVLGLWRFGRKEIN